MKNKSPFVVIIYTIFLSYVIEINAFRVLKNNGMETIMALENEIINIECKEDVPMRYCGFIHPSGKRYSFSGLDLAAGHCSIKVNATKKDNGEWKCHIGRTTTGVEIMQRILVRVVDQLAAVRPNISTVHGKPVTLECATTKEMISLSYCRFEPPNGSPFSIDAGITEQNPIEGKYFFPLNKSVDRGDCAVTIRRVKYEDVGLWTCGAGLGDAEHTDVIRLDVDGLYTMSTASATGITFSVIGAIGFVGLLGFIAWRKGYLRSREPEPVQEQEMRELEPEERRAPLSRTRAVEAESSADPGSSPLMSA